MTKILPQELKIQNLKVTFLTDPKTDIRLEVTDGIFSRVWCYWDGNSISLKSLKEVRLFRRCLREILRYAKKNNIN